MTSCGRSCRTAWLIYDPAGWMRRSARIRRLSRFLARSEVSRLNRAPGVPLQVSTETLDLLLACDRWHEQTEGAFSVTLLDGLNGGARDPVTGAITARTLRTYLQDNMKKLLSPADLANPEQHTKIIVEPWR